MVQPLLYFTTILTEFKHGFVLNVFRPPVGFLFIKTIVFIALYVFTATYIGDVGSIWNRLEEVMRYFKTCLRYYFLGIVCKP